MKKVYLGSPGNLTAIEVPVSPSATRQNFVPPPTGFYKEPVQDETAGFRQPNGSSPYKSPNVYKMSPTPKQVSLSQCPTS